MSRFNNYDWIFERESYSESWTKEQKEHYFLKKRNAKLEIYVIFFFALACLIAGNFSEILLSIGLFSVFVLFAYLVDFRKRYFTFRDTEENKK